MKGFIRRHPAAAYGLLAFGWTWLIVGFMISKGFSGDFTANPLFIPCALLSNLSPLLAAALVTRALRSEGYPRLRGGLKVGARWYWYLIALTITPAATALALLISHWAVRPYMAAVSLPMACTGLVWPLVSVIGEEPGWRGFLLPRLIKRFGTIRAAQLMGVVWECWHLPMHWLAYRGYGRWMIPAFLVCGLATLTLHSLIMAMIYVKSKGSLKLMFAWHYAFAASAMLPGAFFTAIPSPRRVVLESLFSCALLAAAAAGLYVKLKPALALSRAADAN
jgi:uncharacterized protein